MTILGIHLCSRDRALFWTDAELFVNADPVGNASKMALNPLAMIVGAGTGWERICRAGNDAVTRATSFDSLVDSLPDVLRRAAAREAPRRPDADGFRSCTYLATGYSHAMHGLLAASFDAENFFAAHQISSFTSPEIPEIAAMHPSAIADVIGCAQQQVIDLRPALRAGLGTLVAAELRPSGIVTSLFDLATGEPLPAPRPAT